MIQEALPTDMPHEPVAGYRLLRRIGRGGFGEVWEALGPGNFRVALKFVSLGDRVGDVELRALEVVKTFRHPNLLATFGAWQIAGRLIIAMELAEGTLLDRLHECTQSGLPGIPAPELLEYVRESAKGLDYLGEARNSGNDQEQIRAQHRDVKPQNLLLVGGSVKVADFGLARVFEHSSAGHSGALTPAYAAPEFFEGRTTGYSDQYSLAVTYCQLRGGRLPFTGNAVALMAGHLKQAPDLTMLPPEEQGVVDRALAKRPSDRWPSCQEFVKSLAAVRSQQDSLGAGVVLPGEAVSADREIAAEPDPEPTGHAPPPPESTDQRSSVAPHHDLDSAGPSSRPIWNRILSGAGAILGLGLFFLLSSLLGALGVDRLGPVTINVNRGGQILGLGLGALLLGIGLYHVFKRVAVPTAEQPLPDRNYVPMQCSFCPRAGERACTQCGRFFCDAHGGDRLVSEGVGPGYRIVTRGLCDDCTPNQGWLEFQKVLGILILVIIVLFLLAKLMRP